MWYDAVVEFLIQKETANCVSSELPWNVLEWEYSKASSRAARVPGIPWIFLAVEPKPI